MGAAHTMVEQGEPAQAERELTQFVTTAQAVLEHSQDLPGEYVDLLGQAMARCLVARAAARVEQALSGEPGADILIRSAAADAAAADRLPVEWLDQKTRVALTRLHRVLEPVSA